MDHTETSTTVNNVLDTITEDDDHDEFDLSDDKSEIDEEAFIKELYFQSHIYSDDEPNFIGYDLQNDSEYDTGSDTDCHILTLDLFDK